MADKSTPGLATLEKEISRLKTRASQLEDELDDNFKYLQENHLSMLVKSVIPRPTGARSLLITVLGIIFQSDRFQARVDQVFEEGIGKLGRILGRIFSKKKE